MLTVKQVLENYDMVSDTSNDNDIKLSVLAEAGIIEEAWLPMIKRSLSKSVNEMTEAERKTLKNLLETLIDYTLLDESRKMDYPSDKEMPVVIILKRKAIRVYPDNQKVGLYYSQALDRYISIPFGKNSKDLSPVLNENRPLVRTSRPRPSQQQPVSPVLSRIEAQRERTTSTPRIRQKNSEPTPNAVRAVAQREPGLAKEVKKKEDAEDYGRAERAMIRRLGVGALSRAGVGAGKAMKAHFAKGDITTGIAVGTALGAVKGAKAIGRGAMALKDKFTKKVAQIREEQNIAEAAPALPIIAGLGLRAARIVRGATKKTPKKVDKPKADKPKADKPKADKPKADKPKADKPKADKPKLPYRSSRKLPSLNRKDKTSEAGGGDDKPLFSRTDGEYGFTQGGRQQVATNDPISVTGVRSGTDPSAIANQLRQYRTMPGQYSPPNAGRPQYTNESTIEKLRDMVNQNSTSTAIQLGEETITINKSIAKKIIKLHESLTPNNKKKLETMLQEDVVSFRKALNFALKQ